MIKYNRKRVIVWLSACAHCFTQFNIEYKNFILDLCRSVLKSINLVASWCPAVYLFIDSGGKDVHIFFAETYT